jgi:hypothetical protein
MFYPCVTGVLYAPFREVLRGQRSISKKEHFWLYSAGLTTAAKSALENIQNIFSLINRHVSCKRSQT